LKHLDRGKPCIQPFEWPTGYKSCATYTIDVDASTHEYKEGKNISGNLSVGDYGPKAGVPRMLRLFEKHQIKASFFICGWVAERFPEMVRAIHEAGHDVAAHGYLHESSTEQTHEQKIELFKKTQKILSDITGVPCQGLRPIGPAWPDETIRELYRSGFRYFMTTSDTYYPSKFTLESGAELDLLQLNMNWAVDDARYFWGGSRSGQYRPLSSFDDAWQIWKAEFETTHEMGGLFNITTHPRASGRASTIRVHDRLIRCIKGTSGVWFAPVSEIADWVLRK
jgi:peptidoglycan/xylan/chitin deacetylase (PgdA/CDA1 family)